MKIDVHHYFHSDAETERHLKQIDQRLYVLCLEITGTANKLEKIMHTLDETLAKVTEEDTKVDGIIALVAGLKQQLADALAGVTLPPDVQAKVDAVFDKASASADKIDVALGTNVPPTP